MKGSLLCIVILEAALSRSSKTYPGRQQNEFHPRPCSFCRNVIPFEVLRIQPVLRKGGRMQKAGPAQDSQGLQPDRE
jgi:hypothetical protein